MNRHETLISEMQQRAHLSSFQLEVVTQYLNWAHAVGFDDGWAQMMHQVNRGQPVHKILNGEIVDTYDNMVIAARAVHTTKANVRKAAINYPKRKCRGFHWKYAEIKRPEENLAKPPGEQQSTN